MHISDEGLRLIKSFEGYHARLKDGSCAAYLCPAGVPTIGYGCTEGVRIGMVWTQTEADAALAREVAKFETEVDRMATVALNQNQFDALVSFAYNVGAGALEKSTLLRKLNRGDYAGAASEFDRWTRGGGRTLPGLVSRRKREAALFLKPSHQPEDPYMAQAVAATMAPPGRLTIAATATAASFGAQQTIPAVPETFTDGLSKWQGWQSAAEQVVAFQVWLRAEPAIAIGLIAVVAAIWLMPKWRDQ